MSVVNRFWSWITRVSLWLVSIGLMLASSGIDGAYLARIMPAGADWLGYVLNTMSDIGVIDLPVEDARVISNG